MPEVRQLPKSRRDVLQQRASRPRDLRANADGAMVGLTFASDAFMVPSSSALGSDLALRRSGVVLPFTTAKAMLAGKLSADILHVLYLGDCETEAEARAAGGPAFTYLEEHVRSHVLALAKQYPGWDTRWWQPWRPGPEYFATALKIWQVVACSRVQSRPVFVFLSTEFVPNDTLQLFAFDDDYTFGILQSDLHWAWTKAMGENVRERIRYTDEVWRTFPWPQEPSEDEIEAVGGAAWHLRRVRDALMKDHGWSLRTLHQAAEVPGPHPLKDAQAALDHAVHQVYGKPEGQEALAFLRERNQRLAEDEAAGRKLQGPGLPSGLAGCDPRWASGDAIEAPRW